MTILFFMLLAATNFGLYFHLLRGDGRALVRDSEWRFFLGLVAGPVKNFAFTPAAGKWLLSLCMVLGRLELFAVLVLFMPAFWRGR